MFKFRIGDMVKINKPVDVEEVPTWAEPEMDRYNGLILEIDGIFDDVVQFKDIGYVFHVNWLSKIDDVTQRSHSAHIHKCPVCGALGDDLVFEFYCTNKDCQNFSHRSKS